MINKNDMLSNVNNCTILVEKPLNPIKFFSLLNTFYKIHKY